MSFDGLLRHTCNIQKVTKAQDSAGQKIETWANVATGVRCRLDMAKGGEFLNTQGKLVKATHVLFMRQRNLTEKGNRIVIAGNNYDVLLVSDGGGAGHHFEVQLERLY